MLVDGGVEALDKVLEAYMGEVMLPAKPPETYLIIMLRVVVVLLGQYEDQLKSGLPWMEKSTSSHWIPSNEKVLKTCIGWFGDPTMGLVVRDMRS